MTPGDSDAEDVLGVGDDRKPFAMPRWVITLGVFAMIGAIAVPKVLATRRAADERRQAAVAAAQASAQAAEQARIAASFRELAQRAQPRLTTDGEPETYVWGAGQIGVRYPLRNDGDGLLRVNAVSISTSAEIEGIDNPEFIEAGERFEVHATLRLPCDVVPDVSFADGVLITVTPYGGRATASETFLPDSNFVARTALRMSCAAKTTEQTIADGGSAVLACGLQSDPVPCPTPPCVTAQATRGRSMRC